MASTRKLTAIREGIRNEIQAPPLVGRATWHQHGPARPERPFPTAAPLQLQLFFRVEPAKLLLVHEPALALKHQVDTPVPEPAALIGYLLHGLSQITVVQHVRCDTVRSIDRRPRTAHARRSTHLVRLAQMGDSTLASRRASTTFAKRRLSALHCRASARPASLFNLASSSSSVFSFRASETSMPPNLAFHL